MAVVLVLMAVLASAAMHQIRNPAWSALGSGKAWAQIWAPDSREIFSRAQPDMMALVEKLRALPDDRAVFLEPIFAGEPGSENGTFFWWHAGVVLRHFCFPRRIYTLHATLLPPSRREFEQRFSRNTELASRDVGWVLSMKKSGLQLLPLSPASPRSSQP